VGSFGSTIYTEQTILLDSIGTWLHTVFIAPYFFSIANLGFSINWSFVMTCVAGYFLQDSSLLYEEHSDVQLHRFLPLPLPLAAHAGADAGDHSEKEEEEDVWTGVSCPEVDGLLAAWGLSPNISTATFSIPCVPTRREEVDETVETANKKRLYLCIQLNRKMHPLFDRYPTL
jgi:hypothetical protein